jgi:hypothetical protein
MSAINRHLFLYCLGAYKYFNLKDHHSFKFQRLTITKISFLGSCSLAANSVYQCANFNDFIYTGKLICSHSYTPVLSAPLSMAKIFTVHCRFVVGR